ncbi:hypothetical protein AX16_002838 [Volvariella volvacea WC 439]|nr:hypothetical protein AX16_002838 [Volvariella volvacea WC 439]
MLSTKLLLAALLIPGVALAQDDDFAAPRLPSILHFHWYNTTPPPGSDGNYTTDGLMISGVQFTTEPDLPDVQGMVVHFNDSHLEQPRSTAPWIALIPCIDQSSGQTLLTGAYELGARAVMAYSPSNVECPVAFAVPPFEIPVFVVEAQNGEQFGNLVNGFLDRVNVRTYNATQLDTVAEQAQNDLDALNSGSRPGSETLMRTATLLGRFFVGEETQPGPDLPDSPDSPDSDDDDASSTQPPPSNTSSGEATETQSSDDAESSGSGSGSLSVVFAESGAAMKAVIAAIASGFACTFL